MKTEKYNKALIIGFGVSGFAAAKLLLSEGISLIIVDRNDTAEMRERIDELSPYKPEVYFGITSLGDLFTKLIDGHYTVHIPVDICIVSPGIAADDPWIGVIGLQKKIKIISELELGASRLQLPMVAVTGSNGKSTFVKLCGDMFAQNDITAALAGNYGKPLCEVAMEQDKYDWAVVEVSSFQLEYVTEFHPDIAVVLNIEPDHLDRHGNMDTYTTMKSRIFDKMIGDDLALVHNEIIGDVQKRTSGLPLWKSFGCDAGTDYHYQDGVVEHKSPEKVTVLKLQETIFANEITGLTAAAVFAVSEYLTLDIDNLKKALVEFESLPHRLQMIGEYNGVMFVDDSKATNIAALIGALKMVSRPVRLIVGGQLKEEDISKPIELIKNRAKAVYCVGESALVFKKEWKNTVSCYLCDDLDTAMRQAYGDSEAGEVILLAPGCASFDQFSNYKDRGNQFQEIVAEIEKSVAFRTPKSFYKKQK